MHLIIKKPHLDKIKKHLQIISSSSRAKDVLLETTEDAFSFYISTEHSYIKLELSPDKNLSIKKKGKASLNIKTFSDLINNLDSLNDLEIYHADKNYLQFFSGSYECDLVLSEVGEIKDIELPDVLGDPISIPYDTLQKTYTRLKDFCKSFDTSIISSAVLANIHFKKNKDSPFLEAWASDSYRAVFGEFPMDTEEEFQINLYPSTIALLLGLYSDKETIDFYLNETEDSLTCCKEGCIVKIRLNVSTYPSFINWFNMKDTISFTVSKTDLLNVIERNLLLPDKNLKTTLYRVEGKTLSIEYKNSEKGKCKETLGIKGNKDNRLEFCLNNHLLKTLVKAIDANEITFKIHDSLKPIVLLSNPESNFKQFILPARNV